MAWERITLTGFVTLLETMVACAVFQTFWHRGLSQTK